MSILSWLVVGLIAGWLASHLMKGRGYGCLGDTLVGIAGALIGGFLATALFGGDYLTGINLTTVFVAIGGAILLILIVRMLPGRSPL